jgi:hypothetical protein
MGIQAAFLFWGWGRGEYLSAEKNVHFPFLYHEYVYIDMYEIIYLYS